MRRFFIMRGLPGSGKSYISDQIRQSANDNGHSCVVCSADNFMMENGKYVFHPEKLSIAHKKCQELAMSSIVDSVDIVIIDNTNTTLKECKSYKEHIKIAQNKGYDIHIVESDTPWKYDVDELLKKNTHGVPLKSLNKMLARYEENITVQDIIADAED